MQMRIFIQPPIEAWCTAPSSQGERTPQNNAQPLVARTARETTQANYGGGKAPWPPSTCTTSWTQRAERTTQLERRTQERTSTAQPTSQVHSATDTHYRSLFGCFTVIYMDHSPKNEKSVIIYSCSWKLFHMYFFCKMQRLFSPSPHEVMMARIVKFQNNKQLNNSIVMVDLLTRRVWCLFEKGYICNHVSANGMLSFE